MVYSRAERVFILENYFALKLLSAVHEVFSNAYPDKNAPCKITIQKTGKYFETQEVFVTGNMLGVG
jgi:hypothetical protein